MKIDSIQQLRELYGFPSGRAKDKEFSTLDFHATNFINNSPFLVLSTSNYESKQDASPRGGVVGFVKVLNENQLVIPDAKGNNRIDSLTNIVETGKVGLLFLIPGVDETLRLNGSAFLSTDSKYLDLFISDKNLPKSCIVISVEEVYLHCAKAFMRSKLWVATAQINRDDFPTMGEMLKDQLGGVSEAETREAMVDRYKKDL